MKYAKTKLNEREDSVYMTTTKFKGEDGKTIPSSASGDQDKQPMVLVHTCGAHVPGVPQERKRSRFAEGKSEMSIFHLAQDVVHRLYRAFFNLIDLHNRARHGERTALWDVWPTDSWEIRIFTTLLDIVFVNTTNLYANMHPDTETNLKRKDKKKSPQHERNRQLAMQLIKNQERAPVPATGTRAAAAEHVDFFRKENHVTEPIPDKYVPRTVGQPAVLGRNGRAEVLAKPAHWVKNRQLHCSYCYKKAKTATHPTVWKAMRNQERRKSAKTRFQCACGVPVCCKVGTTCYHEHLCEFM